MIDKNILKSINAAGAEADKKVIIERALQRIEIEETLKNYTRVELTLIKQYLEAIQNEKNAFIRNIRIMDFFLKNGFTIKAVFTCLGGFKTIEIIDGYEVTL